MRESGDSIRQRRRRQQQRHRRLGNSDTAGQLLRLTAMCGEWLSRGSADDAAAQPHGDGGQRMINFDAREGQQTKVQSRDAVRGVRSERSESRVREPDRDCRSREERINACARFFINYVCQLSA